jgi:hypothetical protein
MADFTFGTWDAPAEKVNPYLEVISALNDYVNESGNTLASYEVRVPKGDAIKTRVAVSKAANAIDRTARVRINGAPIIEDGKDSGDVRFVFTLTNRHKSKSSKTEDVSEETDMEETEDMEEVTETEPAPVAPVVPAPAPRKR